MSIPERGKCCSSDAPMYSQMENCRLFAAVQKGLPAVEQGLLMNVLPARQRNPPAPGADDSVYFIAPCCKRAVKILSLTSPPAVQFAEAS